jgi:hypothetical protein
MRVEAGRLDKTCAGPRRQAIGAVLRFGTLGPIATVARELDRCVFCGSTEMTEEHLIADWAHRAFARSRKPQNRILASWLAADQLALSDGDPVVTARVICRSCNNEWISGVDRDAADALKPLVRGERAVVLDRAAQSAAAWIYKSALIFDVVQHGPDGDLAGLRAQFRSMRLAGPGCVIYAGPATRPGPVTIPGTPQPLLFWPMGIRRADGTLRLQVNVVGADEATSTNVVNELRVPGYQMSQAGFRGGSDLPRSASQTTDAWRAPPTPGQKPPPARRARRPRIPARLRQAGLRDRRQPHPQPQLHSCSTPTSPAFSVLALKVTNSSMVSVSPDVDREELRGSGRPGDGGLSEAM